MGGLCSILSTSAPIRSPLNERDDSSIDSSPDPCRRPAILALLRVPGRIYQGSKVDLRNPDPQSTHSTRLSRILGYFHDSPCPTPGDLLRSVRPPDARPSPVDKHSDIQSAVQGKSALRTTIRSDVDSSGCRPQRSCELSVRVCLVIRQAHSYVSERFTR